MTTETDFVKDETGDLHESPQRTEHVNAIPDDAAVGEPDYLDHESKQVAKGFIKALATVLTPKPKKETAEHEFGEDENLEVLRDALRYVATQSIKVTDTPARYVKFPRQVVSESPSRIAGYQPNRKRILIRNLTGANTIYLGDAADVSSDTGFQLVAGADVEMFTQDEIYAVVAAGDGSSVAYTVVELYD